jgi:hypothetical protein
MVHGYTRERLEGWVADFCEGDGLRGAHPQLAEQGSALLVSWLVDACDRGDVEPEDLRQEDLRDALLGTIACTALTEEAHAGVPALCRDFLGQLEEAGRLGEGRTLGLYLYAQSAAYERAVSGKLEPITRPGAKLGRNDPCPCGSGKKYKRCCMTS